jgi:transglutaminase-like putative cysteine protease
MLVMARLAVRFLSLEYVFAWANRPLRRIRRFASDEVRWVSWAIASLESQPWIYGLCLARALAAHAMLRRRGIASRLCLGVAHNHGGINAHAWVEVGSEKVVGGAEAEHLTRLADFGVPYP